MARSKSSRQWLNEHVNDPYVQQAVKLGYRSRASFKLLEIQEKDKLIRPGMCVVDLGSAPGGWSQVAAKLVGHKGRVIATDILPMDGLAGVEFIQGDFTEQAVLDQLLELIGDQPVALVMSDMAPNISGIAAVDLPASQYLVELGLDLAMKVLAPGGVFLAKLFQGEGFDPLLAEIKRHFASTSIRKPKSSRDRSREVFVLAKGFKGRGGN